MVLFVTGVPLWIIGPFDLIWAMLWLLWTGLKIWAVKRMEQR